MTELDRLIENLHDFDLARRLIDRLTPREIRKLYTEVFKSERGSIIRFYLNFTPGRLILRKKLNETLKLASSITDDLLVDRMNMIFNFGRDLLPDLIDPKHMPLILKYIALIVRNRDQKRYDLIVASKIEWMREELRDSEPNIDLDWLSLMTAISKAINLRSIEWLMDKILIFNLPDLILNIVITQEYDLFDDLYHYVEPQLRRDIVDIAIQHELTDLLYGLITITEPEQRSLILDFFKSRPDQLIREIVNFNAYDLLRSLMEEQYFTRSDVDHYLKEILIEKLSNEEIAAVANILKFNAHLLDPSQDEALIAEMVLSGDVPDIIDIAPESAWMFRSFYEEGTRMADELLALSDRSAHTGS